MFTTEIRVGRLYEHRLGTLRSDEEFAALKTKGKSLMQSHGAPVVVCADYRLIAFVKAELVSPFVEFLSGVSPHIERSAVLLSNDHGIFSVQMKRMIRDANFPNRRAFEDPREAEAWLGEVLNAEERKRLHAFVEEKPPAGF